MQNESNLMTSVLASAQPLPRPRVRPFRLLKELISTLAFIVAVFTLLQLAIPRSVVHGRSMQPTLQEGQRLVISRINYLFGDPQYGDIVVFNSPSPLQENEPPLIKRVIGKPGDTIELRDQLVYRNGVALNEPYINGPCDTRHCGNETWELGATQYFMMGDNRNNSRDSRDFGPVPAENIVGEAMFRFWPLESIGIVHQLRFPSD